MSVTPLRLSQLGYVTDDLEATAMAWIRSLGAGPFFLLEGMSFQGWSYMGKPQEMMLDIAFGQVGDLMVELIKPDGPWPNVYGEAMPAGCRAHHHGYLVPDVDRIAWGLGREPVTQAKLSETTEHRYFDCRDQLGLHVELITDTQESRAFFDMALQAAREWDGRTDSIRPFPRATS